MTNFDLENMGISELDIAVQDSDLVGFYELKILGDTEAVSESRADFLLGYDPNQLETEIKRDYRLTNKQYKEALHECIAKIVNRQMVDKLDL